MASENRKNQFVLKENEKFRVIADFAYDWIYWVAPDGSFVYTSPSAEKITGYSASEFIKNPKLLRSIIVPQDLELVRNHFDMFDSNDEHTLEFRIKTEKGETKWISHGCQPVFDNAGNWLGRRAANRDITERKKSEADLKASERRWVTTLASIGDAVIATSNEGKITFMNGVAERLTGWSLADASGKSLDRVFNVINEESRKPLENLIDRVLREGIIVGLANHSVLLCKSGVEIPIFDSEAPIKDENGNITGVVLIFSDATEKRKAQKSIENMARFPMENIDPVLRIRADGTILFANPASHKLLKGRQLELGCFATETWRKNIADAMSSKEHLLFEEEHNGRIFEFKVAPLTTEGYANLYATDITEHKKSKETLQKEMQLNQTLLDAMPCVALLLHPETREIVASNRAGVEVGAVPGKQCFSTWGKRDSPCPWCLAPQLWETGQPQHVEVEYKGIAWDAHWLPVNSDLYMHFVFDVTERKELAKTLESQRLMLEDLYDNAPVMYFSTDDKLLITMVNKAMCQMLGYSKKELLGKHYTTILSEKSKENFDKTYAEYLKSGRLHDAERLFVRRDGSTLDVMGEVSAEYSKDGKILYNRSVFRDVTQQKQVELLNRQLVYRLNNLDAGGCYIVESDEQCFSLYADLIMHGVTGLCIVRDDPEMLAKKYGVKAKEIKLLASKPLKGFEALTDLQMVSHAISEFLKENSSGVILLDGLEYLISISDFESVYMFIQEKRFDFLEKGALLLIPINTAALNEKEKALLTSELKLLTEKKS